MATSLHLHAASEEEVAGLVGLGVRDPAAAEVVLGRMVELTRDDYTYDMAPVEAAGRVLLWHPRLPFTGTDDAYWRAVEAMVMLAGRLDVGPAGCRAARDLEDLLAAAGIPGELTPLAVGRRARLPIPGREDFDVRVVEHDDARALLQTWLVAEPGVHDELTRFARDFLALEAETRAAGRRPCDLWLFSPGHVLPCPRLPASPWPPTTPADLGPVGPELARWLRRDGMEQDRPTG